jgi:hypothetical protein
MASVVNLLPRRASARWLAGAPGDVVAVYDSGGKTADRYTILLREWHDRRQQLIGCLGLSDNPTHPQGFSQFSGAMRGPHLGKKLRWDQLPPTIQNHVQARLAA